MTKTIDVKLTLSDCQYEALQAIYRLEANSLDEFASNAIYMAMSAHNSSLMCGSPQYKRLEALINS